MSNLCIIPARMASSRFPNKPLAPILGMPMVGHVALRCLLEPIFDQVVVAACDQEVMDYCKSIGVQAIMTSNKHERASERVQEAAEKLEKLAGQRFKTVTLVQGDEPMTTPHMLRTALSALERTEAPVVNLCSKIDTKEEFLSVNAIKVVRNTRGEALYFSRSPIPNIEKSKETFPQAYKQVCVIPFRRDFLDQYISLPSTYLEEVESIDMNRMLEHGFPVHCAEINEQSYPVDVPEDIKRVEHALVGCPHLKKYMK